MVLPPPPAPSTATAGGEKQSFALVSPQNHTAETMTLPTRMEARVSAHSARRMQSTPGIRSLTTGVPLPNRHRQPRRPRVSDASPPSTSRFVDSSATMESAPRTHPPHHCALEPAAKLPLPCHAC